MPPLISTLKISFEQYDFFELQNNRRVTQKKKKKTGYGAKGVTSMEDAVVITYLSPVFTTILGVLAYSPRVF